MFAGVRLKKQRPTAFTLVEVMIAVLVLAIIAIAYYSALSSGFSVVTSSREDLRATQILMQKAEAVRLCTWSELANFNFTEPYDPSATNSTAGTVYAGSFVVSPATNLPASSSYTPNVHLVTISLSWTNRNGKALVVHNRQLQTQAARYGLQTYVWGAVQ